MDKHAPPTDWSRDGHKYEKTSDDWIGLRETFTNFFNLIPQKNWQETRIDPTHVPIEADGTLAVDQLHKQGKVYVNILTLYTGSTRITLIKKTPSDLGALSEYSVALLESKGGGATLSTIKLSDTDFEIAASKKSFQETPYGMLEDDAENPATYEEADAILATAMQAYIDYSRPDPNQSTLK